jgi:hypothetical protein
LPESESALPTHPLVSQFVQQWSLLADPLRFAASAAASPEETCRILAADQHLRWRQRAPRPLQYYLRHWPTGLTADLLLVDLLVDEFGYREEAGQEVTVARYLRELPELDVAIVAKLLEVLSADGAAERAEHPLLCQFVDSDFVYVPARYADAFWIGRQKPIPGNAEVGCDLVLRCADSARNSLKISRRHLRLVRDGETGTVSNQSKSGTQLNHRILASGQQSPLSVGDELSIVGMLTLRMVRRESMSLGDPVSGEQSIALADPPCTWTLQAYRGTLHRI